MSAQDILAELPRLSAQEREQIAKVLCALEAKEEELLTGAEEPGLPNLHPGAMPLAPDFYAPLQFYPELAATILYNPTEPASEDEWPAEVR